jgi:hypothetical protein
MVAIVVIVKIILICDKRVLMWFFSGNIKNHMKATCTVFVSEYVNILTWYPALAVIVDFQSVHEHAKEYFENMDTH